MKNPVFLFLVIVIITSCQVKTEKSDTIEKIGEKVIVNLNSEREKSDFLYDLWKQDQSLRQGHEYKVIEKFGYKSVEHIQLLKEDMQKNRNIFLQLKIYLEQHGYPKDPTKFHELAINAFPTIIGHHSYYEEQKELLPYLFEAYKLGNCPLKDIVWVLSEMYERKNDGAQYKLKSKKFTTEQEFIELNEVLTLGLSLN